VRTASRLFADCAALASDLGLEQLSMGMSGDWREAVEAGSTWIRVGSGLFGPRPTAPEHPPESPTESLPFPS
jgi:uncharacterized pyridoxal phosphate-containing UPF0001 family protein